MVKFTNGKKWLSESSFVIRIDWISSSFTRLTSFRHYQVFLTLFRKCLLLNNQGRPILFKRGYHVILYLREYYSLAKLYQGFTVSLIRQFMYCPIFALTLPILQKNINPFWYKCTKYFVCISGFNTIAKKMF
jgi:hypothetical protein